MKMIWFFDVDDTTLDSRHRAQFAEERNWKEYFRAAAKDTPLPWTSEYFKDGVFRFGEHRFLTARKNTGRHETYNVLREHGMVRDQAHVIMRDNDFNVHGGVHKARELATFAASNPGTQLVHFDNDLETVRTINGLCSERIKAFELTYGTNPVILDRVYLATDLSTQGA